MPFTVMVVDDDEQILVLVEILLRRQGYTVLKATSPYAALDLLKTNTPDLFLLDYMMPGMNGVELCQHIRATAVLAKTPIVMLSALDSEEFIRLSRDAGANGHIPKSEMHRRLATEIHQYLPTAQSK
ncbi:MAG: response regulator [Chloroflexota bacterium]